MADLEGLNQQLQQLDAQLAQAWTSTDNLRDAFTKLNRLKFEYADDEEALRLINAKIESTKELMRVEKDEYEKRRRQLESLVGSNKTLVDLLEKTILKTGKLGEKLLTTA